jgi:hypothetical protein
MARKNRSPLKTLYYIEVANAMAERCEESAFVGKESRFFTMAFFLNLVLLLYIETILFF